MTATDPTPSNEHAADDLGRYSRQMLFAEIGEAGQRRLLASRVVLIGCGALGTVLADTLVRAGVGSLCICDRDYIELDNLQRQVLFDEDDIRANLPKAEAAARKLRRINSDVHVEGVVTDVVHTNVEQLCDGADLILDGTDNFETRFLINDLAVKTKRPWVYGAVIGGSGLCMAVVPGDTPCLRCVFEEAPPPEMNPTCDTAGVLGPVVHMVAAAQATEALKILTGNLDALHRRLLSIDMWRGRYADLNVDTAADTRDCPCCKQRRFDYLDGKAGSSAETLCGRNAVQIRHNKQYTLDFAAVSEKLKGVASATTVNEFMLRFRAAEYDVTLFPDGRAIIKGTSDPEIARSVYARYIGA